MTIACHKAAKKVTMEYMEEKLGQGWWGSDDYATYYEDKSTSSTPVPMGSYDFVLEGSINVSFLRVVQNGADFCDSKYWGIMASNGVKNLYFKDCEISRYDAHRGFWNGTLENVTLGHSFNVIGGGTLDVRGVTKMVGNKFIDLRSDYGATFEGDILLTNCELKGYSSYNSRNGGKLVEMVTSSWHGSWPPVQ